MQQTALTVVVPIDPQQLDASGSAQVSRQRLEGLRQTLAAAQGPASASAASASAGSAIETELRALFGEVGSSAREGDIHSLSFFAIDAAEGCPAYLVLEINSDGSAAALRARLVALAPQFLLELFTGCPGLDGAASLPRCLRRHSVPADAFYVAFPGRTRWQIREEQLLRRELRDHFEAASSPQPSGVCPRASNPSSLRLSPTSATSIWRTLRDAFTARPVVQQAPERPFFVRWSLHRNGSGGRQSLNVWGKRLGPVLLVAAALAGLWLLQYDVLLLGLRLPAGALALAFGGAWLGMLVIVTAREAPRSLRWRGKWLVWRGVLWEALWAALSVTGALGWVALVAIILHRLTPVQSLLSGLLLASLLFALARVGLGQCALCVATGLCLLGGLLPPPLLALIPAAALALLCAGLVVLLAAFLCLMVGRTLALLSPLLWLGGGIAHLFWHTRSRALEPADLVQLSALGAGALLGVVVLGLVWLGSWFVAVRRMERDEATGESLANQPGHVDRDLDPVERVQKLEDAGFQNHLITVSILKRGRLRTLRRVLRGVDLAAKFVANRGDLDGTRSLHFARFLLLPDRRRLLFTGNYHGGFSASLHAFNTVSGVTAVWSNCVGFPHSYFLLGAGARDEQRLEAFGRKHQVPTLGWYSAYPELSIQDIESATEIREDLKRPIDDPTTWRGRLQARFGAPLREADCDLALRRL